MTVVAGVEKGTTMQPSEIPALKDAADVQAFKDRIGIEKLPDFDTKAGVVADWNSLPGAMPSNVRKMTVHRGSAHSPERGFGHLTFDWTKDPQFLTVQIFVSGIGAKQARDRLVWIASANNMMRIPYKTGPSNLGDIAVEHTVGRSTSIIWAYRNVCIQIDNSHTSIRVEPVARAIQAFMKANLVPDISPHLPRAEAVVISPKSIRVGDQVQVAVTLAKNITAADILTDINQGRERLLANQGIKDLTAKYLAERPGRSRIDVSLVNRKTLLSPDLSVEFDVLP